MKGNYCVLVRHGDSLLKIAKIDPNSNELQEVIDWREAVDPEDVFAHEEALKSAAAGRRHWSSGAAMLAVEKSWSGGVKDVEGMVVSHANPDLVNGPRCRYNRVRPRSSAMTFQGKTFDPYHEDRLIWCGNSVAMEITTKGARLGEIIVIFGDRRLVVEGKDHPSLNRFSLFGPARLAVESASQLLAKQLVAEQEAMVARVGVLGVDIDLLGLEK